MSTSSNLSFIVDCLNKAPFNKSVSIIQLHDDWTFFQLLCLLNEVIVSIDSAGNANGSQGSNFVSRHKVDLRDETAEVTTQRLIEFLALLKYKVN